jgi:ABC-type glycerol-3-phosphate transport system substrate-binding protein
VIEFISKNDYKKEICMSLDEDKLADLIISDNTVMPSLINMNIFSDISDYINDTLKTSNYYSELWNNTRSDGKYYGIPFTCDPYVLIWNKDLFARKNVDVPTNWEDLKKAAALVEEFGTHGFGIGVKQSEEITAFFIQMLYTTGGSIREINGEDGMKVFKLLKYLKDNKLISKECINWDQLDLTNQFLEGKVAMMVNNLSSVSVLRAKDVEFEVGIAAVPMEKKENYMYHGKNIGITTTADYEEALEFLDYITTKEIVQQVAEITETIPVQIMVDYNLNNDKFALSKEFVEKQKDYGIAKSSLNSWFDISSAISDGIYELMKDNTSLPIETIADTMQDKVRTAIIDN